MSTDAGVRPVTAATSPPAPGRARRPGLIARYERRWLPLVTVAAVLGLWELLGQLGSIDPILFSWPSEMFLATVDLARDGSLGPDLAVSGKEFGLGFALALAGIPLGLASGYWRRLGYALDPLITALYSAPIVALTPLFVLWFGLGTSSKVAVIAVMAIFPIVISTMEGVRTVAPDVLRAARSFRASPAQVLRHVILPGSLPFIVTGVRLGIGRAVIGLVIGEFIASVAGIGYRIRQSAENFQTAEYLGVTVLLMIFSVLLTAVLRVVEKRIAPWNDAAR